MDYSSTRLVISHYQHLSMYELEQVCKRLRLKIARRDYSQKKKPYLDALTMTLAGYIAEFEKQCNIAYLDSTQQYALCKILAYTFDSTIMSDDNFMRLACETEHNLIASLNNSLNALESASILPILTWLVQLKIEVENTIKEGVN